jgi:Hypoxanthine-guanine phosphoribosyltransferase
VRAKFIGMNAGNDFIIGYGLDYEQRYRNLPFVAKLIQE